MLAVSWVTRQTRNLLTKSWHR